MRASTGGLNGLTVTVQPVACADPLKQASTFSLRDASSCMLVALMVNRISLSSGIMLDAAPPTDTMPGGKFKRVI